MGDAQVLVDPSQPLGWVRVGPLADAGPDFVEEAQHLLLDGYRSSSDPASSASRLASGPCSCSHWRI
jgi:hypothetical protein